jgi:hypothetical protein
MLQTVLDFAAHNPVLAVFLFVAMEVFTVVLISLPFLLANRFLRSRNIAKHGWPTPPLDADGDVVWFVRTGYNITMEGSDNPDKHGTNYGGEDHEVQSGK